MKLHDLQPAEGSRKDRIRVGRGIAAGKGKTAGRGTKGQTPLHQRIPKLRGFKNRGRIEYEVVNVGAIDALVARGAFESAAPGRKGAKPSGSGQITVNQDILRAVGLVRTLNKPLKILGAGELTVPLFVVADAFTASARAKIEAAGGVVNVLEMPTEPLAALGVEAPASEVPAASKAAKPRTRPAPAAVTAEPAPTVDDVPPAEPETADPSVDLND